MRPPNCDPSHLWGNCLTRHIPDLQEIQEMERRARLFRAAQAGSEAAKRILMGPQYRLTRVVLNGQTVLEAR